MNMSKQYEQTVDVLGVCTHSSSYSFDSRRHVSYLTIRHYEQHGVALLAASVAVDKRLRCGSCRVDDGREVCRTGQTHVEKCLLVRVEHTLHSADHGAGGVAVERKAMVDNSVDNTAEAVASELLQGVVVG